MFLQESEHQLGDVRRTNEQLHQQNHEKDLENREVSEKLNELERAYDTLKEDYK